MGHFSKLSSGLGEAPCPASTPLPKGDHAGLPSRWEAQGPWKPSGPRWRTQGKGLFTHSRILQESHQHSALRTPQEVTPRPERPLSQAPRKEVEVALLQSAPRVTHYLCTSPEAAPSCELPQLPIRTVAAFHRVMFRGSIRTLAEAAPQPDRQFPGLQDAAAWMTDAKPTTDTQNLERAP